MEGKKSERCFSDCKMKRNDTCEMTEEGVIQQREGKI